MGKKKYDENYVEIVRAAVKTNFNFVVKGDGDAFDVELTKMWVGDATQASGNFLFNKGLDTAFLNNTSGAKDKNFKTLKDNVAELKRIANLPKGSFDIDLWNDKVTKLVPETIAALDAFNKSTDYAYINNPNMTALKQSLNKFEAACVEFESQTVELGFESRFEELEQIIKNIYESSTKNHLNPDESVQNELDLIKAANEINAFADDKDMQVKNAAEKLDDLVQEKVKENNELTQLAKDIKADTINYDAMQKEYKQLCATEKEARHNIAKAEQENNIPGDFKENLKRMQYIELFMKLNNAESINDIDFTGKNKEKIIVDFVRINPLGMELKTADEKKTAVANLNSMGADDFKNMMREAYSQSSKAVEKNEARFPDYVKSADKYIDCMYNRMSREKEMLDLSESISAKKNQLKEKVNNGRVNELMNELEAKKASLNSANEYKEKVTSYLKNVNNLNGMCKDAETKKKELISDIDKSCKGINGFEHSVDFKNKYAKQFKALSEMMNECRRSGHKDSEEFTALYQAVSKIKDGNDVSEHDMKNLKSLADDYLNKKKEGLNLNTKMRRHRLDTAKRISVLAGACEKGIATAKARDAMKTLNRITSVLDKVDLKNLSVKYNTVNLEQMKKTTEWFKPENIRSLIKGVEKNEEKTLNVSENKPQLNQL